MADPRATYTSVLVQAESLTVGEIVSLGGVCFTRLAEGHQLNRAVQRQKQRYIKILGIEILYDPADYSIVDWVEVKFKGGDCPSAQRTMYALFRPYELVRVQVVREG